MKKEELIKNKKVWNTGIKLKKRDNEKKPIHTGDWVVYTKGSISFGVVVSETETTLRVAYLLSTRSTIFYLETVKPFNCIILDLEKPLKEFYPALIDFRKDYFKTK